MIKNGINHLLPSHNSAVALTEACHQSESENKMLRIAATHINMSAHLKFE